MIAGNENHICGLIALPERIPGTEIRGLTQKQAAAIAGLSVSSFKKARREGKYPRPTLPGKRYDRRLLEAAMDRLSGIEATGGSTPLEKWREVRHAGSLQRN
jgi:hypothetical protein